MCLNVLLVRKLGVHVAPALRNEQLLADYERMQQQQGFLEDESGPCGSSSTCWGPDDLPPPGVILPGGIEKVGWAAGARVGPKPKLFKFMLYSYRSYGLFLLRNFK